MKKLFCSICLILTACGTVKVQGDGAFKKIEYTNPPAISSKPGGAFMIPEVQRDMQFTAMSNCPEGYKILKQRLNEDKTALIWEIQCF